MTSSFNFSRVATQLSGTSGSCLSQRIARGALALSVASVLTMGALGNQASAAEVDVIEASRNSEAAAAIKTAAKNRGGRFRRVDHPTTGSVTLVTDSSNPHLLLSRDFRTDSGPALEIILYSGSRVPKKIERSGQRYYRLAKLRKVNGSDRYALPKDINLSQYKSVAIWCEEFDVTFGYAPLN
ncbi:MAG: DM13 domain-containing protein [Cyanobacteria bacterium P01_D01_bin.73]